MHLVCLRKSKTWEKQVGQDDQCAGGWGRLWLHSVLCPACLTAHLGESLPLCDSPWTL